MPMNVQAIASLPDKINQIRLLTAEIVNKEILPNEKKLWRSRRDATVSQEVSEEERAESRALRKAIRSAESSFPSRFLSNRSSNASRVNGRTE